MEIRYVQWGLANNFGEYIELNENLKMHPQLHKALLDHELGHTDKKGFTKEDFLLDLGPTNVNYIDLFIFMCKHPKTFLQFAPIYRKEGSFIYDVNMIIAWGAMVLVAGLAIFLAAI